MQQVEGFKAGDEFAFAERLAHRGIDNEVVGVETAAAIATTAVHGGIGHQGSLQPRRCVAGIKAILKVEDIECLKVIHPACGVSPVDLSRCTDVESIFVIFDVSATLESQGVDGVHMAFHHS